jgi:sec-independent protein translocase protein TatB
MFGMSFVELSVVLVLALLLLGPDQLPGVARTLGKSLRELRRASDDLKQTFEHEMTKLEAEVNQPLNQEYKPKPLGAATNSPELPSVITALGSAASNLATMISGKASSATPALLPPAYASKEPKQSEAPKVVTLDQARQSQIDPSALRAQARTVAADPGAARAAARAAAHSATPASSAASPSLPSVAEAEEQYTPLRNLQPSSPVQLSPLGETIPHKPDAT